MGTQAVTSPVTTETLKNRAIQLRDAYTTLGKDFTTPVTHTDENGAVFTFKKDATTGEVKCTYTYHNEKPREILLFKRSTVATGNASLAYFTDPQLAEYRQNNPNSFYATGYSAASDAIKEKERLERQLNHYDSDVRDNAIEQYEELIAQELFLSGTVDKKTARKMAKYARKDAQAGQRAEHTTVYLDKKDYEEAKKSLKHKKERIEKSIKKGFAATPAQMDILESQVLYIKDPEVRDYINSHKNLFFDADGNFSSDMYQDWIVGHLQGDNTLTTGERKSASQATGLSEGDVKHAVRDAGRDTQNDYTMYINLAKTAASMAAPLVFAYMTNHNIHEVSKLRDVIEIYASNPDPSQYNEFISAISKAEAISEVTANFRNVAVRNAFFGALGPAIANLWDPKAQRDKVSDAITASTITTQNIFRGNEVTHIEGEVVLDEGKKPSDACYEIEGTPGTEGKEATPDENVINLEMNKKGNVIFWYQTAEAYDIPEGLTKKDIYSAVRKANGDPDCNKYPPDIVGLPEYLEITKNGKTYKVYRSAKFVINGTDYKSDGKGTLETGKTYVGRKGTAAVAGTPGNFKVKDCETGEVIKDGFTTELEALDWIEQQRTK